MTAHTKGKAAKAGEQAAFQTTNNNGNDTHLATTVKIIELTIALSLGIETLTTDTNPCSCCGAARVLSTMEPKVVTLGDQLCVAWVCPNCLGETNATGGSNVKDANPITMAQLDAMLLAAYKWLDSKLLQRGGKKLFIRRPTFAERQKALATGVALPSGSAVVVSPHGEGHLGRRLMPMPFPWRDEQEWMAGPMAAQSAVDLADAIGRGEVDMLEVNGNAMFFASDKVLGRLMAGS